MAYNNIISRTDAGALIPEEVSNEMLTNLSEKAQGSAALQLFKRIPVGRKQVRFPVLSALPVAYFVNGDTGLKQTTEVNWANKYLDIEEIAVIVPIPDSVLDDADVPIWSEVQPLVEEAAGRKLDAAVFFGSDAPAVWPDDVVTAATAAGNTAVIGTSTAAQGGIVGDHSNMLGDIEADGYDPTGGVASRTLRGLARQARNADGDRYGEISVSRTEVEIDGVNYTFPMRGLWPTAASTARAIAFDGSEFVIGVRQDITWKLLTEAVIQDGDGNIVYNLAQQDMVAMRMVFRVGWQVSNPINYDEDTEADRYPAAVLLAAA